MDEFFRWLSNTPVATIVLILAFSLLTLSIIVIYLAAFLQGRDVSFYPPKIGPKPSVPKDPVSLKADKDVVVGRQTAIQDGIKVNWPPSEDPKAQSLLAHARRSLLLIGTSNIRVMHDDFYKYREWLQEDKQKLFGMLFLNPHSPHAFHRDRRDVKRSSVESIVEAIKAATAEAKTNSQFIPAIYDGPYRYSARVSDLVPPSGKDTGEIRIFTSTHQHGISGGFELILSPVKSNDAYDFYKQEVLGVWNQALANPPGHGISTLYRIEPLFSRSQLTECCDILASTLGESKHETVLFSPEQFHVTIASLCRTQKRPFAGPYSLTAQTADENLPLHFGEFILNIIYELERVPRTISSCTFSQVLLDAQGNVVLICDDSHSSSLRQQTNRFIKFVSNLVSEMSKKYPLEDWGELLEGNNEPRFGPKYSNFIPHMSIGKMFDRSPLPLPIKGRYISAQLPMSLQCKIAQISLVHYAYRSLLRVVGEIPLNDGINSVRKESEVLRLLGIQ